MDDTNTSAAAEMAENAPAETRGAVSIDSKNWQAEIRAAEKNLEKWHEQARKINNRFIDKRDAVGEGTNKLNLFTTNVQILISTLYARFPKPLVVREYEDENDDPARVAGNIMERMLRIRSRDSFDTSARQVVQDRLVPGLGQIWFRYDPVIQQVPAPQEVDLAGNPVGEPQMVDQKVDEKVVCDYVHWEDFLFSPARTWAEVRWVGRRIKMIRADAEKRFGEVIAKALRYTQGSRDGQEGPEDKVEYAYVYEIWNIRDRRIYWISKDLEYILDVKEDELKLPNFWPCPRPLMALHTSSNLVPRPDYLLAQDQYEELDTVNHRITMIERAIKVVGVYDGNNDEIKRIFTEGVDNQLIPMRSFGQFAERGGFKGSIDWLPIEAMVNALDKLRQYRQDLIQQIYEIVGISDIMRGSSKASETLGAQQLKAQYGSVKLQYLQLELATFIEEALEIKADIIRQHFDPEIIVRQSNIMNSTDAPLVQQAVQLIKSSEFEFRVEVHADSMAVPEFTAERDGRMAFMRAVSEMMVGAEPILQRAPSAGIAMLQMIQWAAASFRTGNSIETILDQAIAEIRQTVANPPPPPPPDPQVVAKTKKDETQAVLNLAKADEATAKSVTAIMGDPNGGTEGNPGTE